jgi:NADP-dependent alcohol dehydrogenase
MFRDMNNFIYHNPVKIAFGKGQIEQLDKLLPAGGKILLTYGGGSIFKNGVYDQVKKALGNRNITEFGGIEPNPKYETLLKAVEIIKNEGISFILAVGGGSVIDGSKLLAGAGTLSCDPWDIVTGKVKIEKALPLGAVLTLPATGTEMNGNSVISKASTKEKYGFGSPLVMPQFSILDPTVCYSLPDTQIANGIVDAFVHVMEQYLTYPVNAEIQDRYAESILCVLTQSSPALLKNKEDYDTMANLVWSATMALCGLVGAGVPGDWGTHIIGHELTALHELDHAKTLAIVLPGIMSVMRENKKDKILQYGQRVWGIDPKSPGAIDAAIAKTDSFFQQVGIGTKLSDYGIGQQTIDTIVKRFTDRGMAFGEKGDVTPGKVRLILEERL